MVSALASLALSAVAADPLESGFLNPPDSAKPHTWWHWMNGNITQVGIQEDLKAMKEIGLGGATIVNVDSGIPRGPVEFMSPEWRDDFKYAVQQADQLGFKLCVENCAGWSSSGGPWNTPTNAMQHVTISEERVTGPTNFSATLPQPATTLGFYRDIAVLAFPESSSEEIHMRDFSPVATVSTGEDPGDKLTDGDAKTLVMLPPPKPGQPQFAQLAFPQPFSAQAVKITGGRNIPGCTGQIFVSDDGKSFQVAHDFSVPRHIKTPVTVSLGEQPVTARFWRVQFNALETRSQGSNIPVAEIELSPRLFTENVEAKDGQSGAFVLSDPAASENTAGAVPLHDVLNLMGKMDVDGKLNWSVPAGRWVILRIGYTPTGVNNHPAAWGGLGLECDKFSKSALDQHWNGFMQKVLDDLGPLAGNAFNASLIDSYEVGGQNWTKDFAAEFKKRRGYDPVKYLPTFTGRVVGSPALTERFLWDVRRTIADLFAENYYAHFAELCHEHGIKSAVEPYTGPFESLQSGATADIVMGEFWSTTQGDPSIKLAASVAHIYGKTIVGAESFTASSGAGRWQNDPYSEKALGDLMYCEGLNRYYFHRYASQPWTNRWPGMTMGPWGFHFERTITWWQQGKAWIDYISHCEFMLQQGSPVRDAAYFDGESCPAETRSGNPPLPSGYDYDDVNSDVLMHAKVKDGRLILSSGASYAVLVLPPEDINMTPQMLACLRKLVRAGLTVVGPRPQHSPSLQDYPRSDARVKAMADELWGNADGTNVLEHAYGKGHVAWGKPLADIFAEQNLPPDFAFTNSADDANMAYAHRVTGDTDLYFISNQHHAFSSVDCTFRVAGKIPELWHPDTGLIEPAPVWSAHDGRTTVHLDFDPAGSVFVVFRQPAGNADHIVAVSGKISTNSSAAPKLEIQRAVYAATDGAGQKDVTGKVSALVQAGEPVVADNNMAGGDPAINHVKELRLDYTVNGQPRHVTAPENEALALPEVPSGRSSPWELVAAASGPTALEAWSNGEFELRTASGKTLHAGTTDVPSPQEVTGDWTLNFPPNWGAPDSVTLDKLISWTDHTNSGVRYFSGTATYEKDIDIPADRLIPGRELWLDLGRVKNFAQITLNGHESVVLWKPPFRVNLTPAAHPGVNHLTIKVTNLWPNRLIGDEQLPPDVEWDGDQLKAWPQWLLDGKPSPTGRLTFTTWHHYNKDSQLLESGLLGPVTLQTAERVKVQ